MKAPNPIDVVEAAYTLDTPDTEWLGTLGERVLPLLDGGMGVFTYRFDIRVAADRWLDSAVAIGMTVDQRQVVETTIRGMQATSQDSDMRRAHVMPGSLATLRAAMAEMNLPDAVRAPGPLGAMFRTVGAVDACALRTVEPGGQGIIAFALLRSERAFDARTKRLWSKVTAHIAAARRLRDSVQRAGDAVLTPSGKLDHAEGDATAKPVRELLRDAVLRRERARGRTRREDPEAATELWTGLVSGRWSLVDRFERGGRRFIVARRNEHGCTDPRALTDRERTIAHLAALAKSNKLIAYELGLAESTVATHLGDAMRKLGVKSRVELLPILAQLATPQKP